MRARGAERSSRSGRALRWAGLALLLAAAAVVAAAGVTMPRRFYAGAPIEALEIRIAGPGYLDAAAVREALGVAPGTPLREIDPEEACRQLRRELPRVAQARWLGGWFERPVLEIVERSPVGMIVGPRGEALEVAEDGLLLPPRGETLADLPLLTWSGGTTPQACSPGTLFDVPGGPDLMALLGRLRQDHASLWRDISQAHLHPDGTYELFWSEQPTVVRGRGPVSAVRLQAWSAVLADLRERGESDAVIDLRFRDQIIVSLPGSETPAARPRPPAGEPRRG